MFGMGGMNPKNMEKIMKQLGMQTTSIDAEEVIIKCKDKNIVISNPGIQKISISGQESFQITGNVSEASAEEKEKYSDADIELVMEKTGCPREKAIEALEETGDIAEAIMKLEQ